jgi:glycosyltransferase involved in cell wall biosynthesis
LAERVLELAADPERRATLSANVRARVREQFSWQAGARVLVEVYRSILRGTSTAQVRTMGGIE